MIEKGMPDCPSQCGGPNANLHRLTVDQLAHRKRWGCDFALVSGTEVYGITCPVCDGAGCPVGPNNPANAPTCVQGQRPMKRCPGSCQTRDISRALRAYGVLKEFNTWPVPGALCQQSASFVAFVSLLSNEMGFIREEQRKKTKGKKR